MKNVQWILFTGMVLAQLAVPLSMIATHERTLTGGTAYKFRCGPVDPYDYFRGRYVALSFPDMNIPNWHGKAFQHDDPAYARLGVDDEGFAKIVDVTSSPPDSGDYLSVKAWGGPGDSLWVTLPFSKYYMNEFDAPLAEAAYRDRTRTEEAAYAVVHVRDGHGIIEGLYVDEVPVEEYILRGPESAGGTSVP